MVVATSILETIACGSKTTKKDDLKLTIKEIIESININDIKSMDNVGLQYKKYAITKNPYLINPSWVSKIIFDKERLHHTYKNKVVYSIKEGSFKTSDLNGTIEYIANLKLGNLTKELPIKYEWLTQKHSDENKVGTKDFGFKEIKDSSRKQQYYINKYVKEGKGSLSNKHIHGGKFDGINLSQIMKLPKVLKNIDWKGFIELNSLKTPFHGDFSNKNITSSDLGEVDVSLITKWPTDLLNVVWKNVKSSLVSRPASWNQIVWDLVEQNKFKIKYHIEEHYYKNDYSWNGRVNVWKTNNFEANKDAKIIFIHDGQIIFDQKDPTNAMTFKMEKTLNDLNVNAIIIGPYTPIDITPYKENFIDRANVLSPFNFDKKMLNIDKGLEKYRHGKANGIKHVNLIMKKILPDIIKKYELTKNNPKYIFGVSLGGAINNIFLDKYPNDFEAFGLLSPAFWYNKEEHFKVASKIMGLKKRIYIDIGTQEEAPFLIHNYLNDAKEYHELIKKQNPKSDVKFVIEKNGTHWFNFWAKRMKKMMPWFLDIKNK